MISSGSWFPIYRMQTVSLRILVLLSLASTFTASRLTEHKVHNIVLYPDKHSWCKTTEIKQIVAYPGCSSIEIDNNVCVGACFSYSIPKTIPSAPGEVIIPYCDSCQPVEYEWREVTLTCSDESEEEEGQTEMTKRVQVITNCSCTSCEKQYGDEKKMWGYQKHAGNGSSGSGSSGSSSSGSNTSGDDVPELMSLMMGVHQAGSEGKDSEEEEEAAEDVNFEVAVPHEKTLENQVTPTDDKENLIDGGDDEDEKRLAAKLDKESRTLEILHLNSHNGSSNRGNDLIEIAKSEHKHYEIGPHHSLVVKPDEVEKPSADVRDHHHHHHQHNHHESGTGGDDDDEEKPSLLGNQFKIHDNEEYLDQIALESAHKEIEDHKIMSVPDMIYNSSLKNEKWRNGVRKLEVPHHHLQPAVEGVELSYFGKSETKDGKLNDEE